MLSCLENQERIRIIDLEFSMVHDGNYVGLFSKSGAEESRSRLKIVLKNSSVITVPWMSTAMIY